MVGILSKFMSRLPYFEDKNVMVSREISSTNSRALKKTIRILVTTRKAILLEQSFY